MCAFIRLPQAVLKAFTGSGLRLIVSDEVVRYSRVGGRQGLRQDVLFIHYSETRAAGNGRAVSLEGTLAGFAGSVLAAPYAVAVGLTPRQAMAPVIIAAFVATTCESWLGAGAQGSVKWLTNEVINFLNTLMGPAWGRAVG